jgi:hypothetical protein
MRLSKPTCKAMTRRGTACQCKPEPGKKRCRLHGGRSTGPKTPAGRDQSRRNLLLAQAALARPECAQARRQRSLNGWKNRRLRERYRQLGIPW